MKDNSFSRVENSVEKSLPINKKVVIIKEDPSVLTTKLGLNNTAQVRFHEIEGSLRESPLREPIGESIGEPIEGSQGGIGGVH